MVRPLLHLEGAIIALASGYIFFIELGYSWWLLPVFILAPDLSMVGYLANPRIGATLYNLAHTYALSVPIAMAGLLSGELVLLATGILLAGHTGMDRAFGYGLKYPTAFKDTHFQILAEAENT